MLGRNILVGDTYDALLKIANHHHKQINPVTIAITGSNGKTTVKEMIGRVLDEAKTVITNKNENNQFGIPYTILRCTPHTETLILECGARHDGDFRKIAQSFTFDQLIITNINNSHVGVFGSIDNIIRTKLDLIGDDTYNANPSSMQSAMKNINDWSDERGRIVILGDMYDLGHYSSQEHKKVVNYALRMNQLRKLILVGDKFTNEIKEFSDNEREKIIIIQNKVDDFPLLELTRDSSIKSRGVVHRYFKSDGGIILIKGSRAMKMERFVQSILKYLQ